MENQKRGLDNPEIVKKILRVFYVLCAVVLMLDFVVTRKVEHAFEVIPGFYALYGFVGCVILVLIAKWMRIFLMRSEDYYSSSSKPDGQRDRHGDN